MTSPNHWVNKKAKRTLSFDEVLHYQKVVVALKETMQLIVELDHPTSEAESSMTEIIFLVEDDPEGGYVARALGESIFTQADSIQELRELVKDAVHCHYPDEATRPKLIRLHIVHDEVIAS